MDEGFNNFYKNNNENDFKIVIVILSGRLFGRYIKKIKDNINKIINIPYTYIFTSSNYKNVLLNLIVDKEHILSYDSKIKVNSGFYNPGGVYDNFDDLLNEINKLEEKIVSNIRIKQRIKNKINYEGLLTFEYLDTEEDLLAPALYKDILTNEEITKEDCKNFHNFILSFNSGELNTLIKNLDLFKIIPFEILSKYWARCYSVESDFYKVLNNDLMKSKISSNYKTFIKMLYTGVEINSLKSYPGKYLFRGAVINKTEIEKIKYNKKIGKLINVIAFSKAFLSFSENKDKAESFCGVTDNTKIGCLFILENANINSHESNADIQQFSIFPQEKEILFFPGSSFIIKDINYIKDNKIEIILNYNGKFKEKYSIIYENQKKINDLIYNNKLTKNISSKKLCFLKNGKYLRGEIINRTMYGCIYNGKDLETDEIVTIKQIKKDYINLYKNLEKKFIKEVNLLKNLPKTIKYSCKYKDIFETKYDFYIIRTYYDNKLSDFFFKNGKFSPNLIKKIFKQINEVIKELLNNKITHIDIKLENILIKYTDAEKTNFDSFLLGYGICENDDDNILIQDCIGSPSIMDPFMLLNLNFRKKYKNICNLLSIGVTIYLLYFGEYPFLFSDINLKIEKDRELEDLLIKLLNNDSYKRISWEEYFDHPFFKQYEY